MDIIIPRPPVRLTPQQVITLSWLAQGYKTREIAEIMFIHRRTVEYHISCVYAALDCHNKVQALNWARENQLLITDLEALRNATK